MFVKDLIVTGDAKILGNLYTKDGNVGTGGGGGGEGGSGVTYKLTKSGSTITLTGSDGSSSSVTDSNTTASVDLSGYVPTSRTVNGKALTGNISLSASDVGASASNHSHSAATTGAAGLMSAADKQKLDGIAAGANNYTYSLPAATSSTLGGVKVGSNISLSSGTISLTKANVTNALGYTPPTTNTTYSNATQSAAGLMSASDKAKLDGIASGANNFSYSHPSTHPASMITGLAKVATSGSYNDLSNKPSIPAAYTHPTSSGNKHIPSGGSAGQILRWSSDGTAAWGNDNNTTYTLSSFGINASAYNINNSIVHKGQGGKDNVWKYEYYPDGRMILYANIPVTNVNIHTQFGNMYRSLAAFSESDYAFPFTFTETPVCIVEYQQTNNVGAWSMVGSVATTKEPPGVYLIRPTTGTTTGVISMIVKGYASGFGSSGSD